MPAFCWRGILWLDTHPLPSGRLNMSSAVEGFGLAFLAEGLGLEASLGNLESLHPAGSYASSHWSRRALGRT